MSSRSDGRSSPQLGRRPSGPQRLCWQGFACAAACLLSACSSSIGDSQEQAGGSAPVPGAPVEIVPDSPTGGNGEPGTAPQVGASPQLPSPGDTGSNDLVPVPRSDGFGPSFPEGSYPSFYLDELQGLARGATQNQRFCQQPLGPDRDDVVRRAFCGGSGFPQITNLRQFLQVLGLDPDLGSGTKLALAAHSSSISMRSASAINPRVFVFTDFDNAASQHPEAVIVSYIRGEPYVEVAAKQQPSNGYGRNDWNFYAARIETECEATGTCTEVDFLTDKFESGWVGVSLYEDLALRNTPLDCLRCHARGQNTRFGDGPLLLFAERRDPWTHWFSPDTPEGRQYIDKLLNFVGEGRDYGLISREKLKTAPDPERLWKAMYLSFMSTIQPVVYDPGRLQREGDAGATWQVLWTRFVNAEIDAPPHYSPHVEDPAAVSRATEMNQRFLAGEISDSQYRDFRDVFDRSKLVELGHVIEPQPTPEATLVNACGQCHNSSLPQDISRAGFNVEQPRATPAEFVRDRLTRPADDPRRMPPLRYRVLSDAAREQLLEFFAE